MAQPTTTAMEHINCTGDMSWHDWCSASVNSYKSQRDSLDSRSSYHGGSLHSRQFYPNAVGDSLSRETSIDGTEDSGGFASGPIAPLKGPVKEVKHRRSLCSGEVDWLYAYGLCDGIQGAAKDVKEEVSAFLRDSIRAAQHPAPSPSPFNGQDMLYSASAYALRP